MNRYTEGKIGSTIYERIQSIPMSAAEREVALSALEDAEAIADAFGWLKSKLEQVVNFLFLKPSVKH